jgi:hypothetical protein
LFDAAGGELPFTYRQGGDQVVTSHPPARVSLAPGGTAYVTINKYRCDLGAEGAASAVEVLPPGDTADLRLTLPVPPTALTYCSPGDPGSTVSVSPIGATFGDTVAH